MSLEFVTHSIGHGRENTSTQFKIVFRNKAPSQNPNYFKRFGDPPPIHEWNSFNKGVGNEV